MPATFAGEIEKIKARYDQEKWRMGVARGLAFWREFIAGWASAATVLRAPASAYEIPDEVVAEGDQSVLSWAWSLVEHETNAVLHAVDLRTPLPSAVIVSHFRVLSGSGLIFPDGSVCSFVLRSIERTLSVEEARDNRTIAESSIEMTKLRRMLSEKAGSPGKKRR